MLILTQKGGGGQSNLEEICVLFPLSSKINILRPSCSAADIKNIGRNKRK
jgi:hypothetical protein